MFRWVPYPFLRLTPALILGVLIGLHYAVPVSVLATALLVVLYGVAVVATPARWQQRFSPLFGTAALLIIVGVGIVRVGQYRVDQQPNHLSRYEPAYSHYVATVTADASERSNSWRTTARLQHVLTYDSSGVLHPSPSLESTVLIYQPKEDSLRLLGAGDQIVVKGTPQLIKPPTNPHAFDLQRYWADQQVYHQHYLRAEQWRLIKQVSPNKLTLFIQQMQRQSKKQITRAVVAPQAQGIALALVLGVKDQLADQVRQAYSRAGAMHVLAVSGLHIGIVYGVVAFLLGFLQRSRRGRMLHALACVVALWLFALVTGGSVSVMRAATMFTCVIVAQASQRRANIFNTLALSAFVLLLINPYYLLSVGFQLSYLAVLGIVYLQPRIYGLLKCRSWLADKLWALTAVSIAAQLATLPISLYYFHQFPTYFWLANIVVIPAAFVILSLGLLTITVGTFVPAALPIVGKVLEAVISGVNTLIYSLERLPMSYIDRLYVDIPQVLMLYGALVAAALLFHYRRFFYLVATCSCLLAFAALRVLHYQTQQQQKAITFYQVNKQSHVDFTAGYSNFHWGTWNKKAAYQIEPNHIQAGFVTTFLDTATVAQHPLPLVRRGSVTLAVWQGKRLAFVSGPLPADKDADAVVELDYLVVSNNAVRQLRSLDAYFSYDLLIIDSSNSHWRAQQLTEEARNTSITYHSVPAQGALQLDL
jgi:competence protein ComEC